MFGIIVSQKSYRITHRVLLYKTFILQFRWGISLAAVELPQQTNEFNDCEIWSAWFNARWCVHATCYARFRVTLPMRRELCVQRKSARPLALVTSEQVVSHRRYSQQVLVSMPNFRFVRPFLVAFYRDSFNSSCSLTDELHYRDNILNQVYFQDWIVTYRGTYLSIRRWNLQANRSFIFKKMAKLIWRIEENGICY